MKRWSVAIFAVVSVILAIFIEPLTSDINMRNLVDYSMDMNNNFYFINSDKNTSYFLKKSDSKGNQKFSKQLLAPNNGDERIYKRLDTDTQGNVYVLFEDREKIEIPDSMPKIGKIKSEKVSVYSSNGDFLKDIASVDFTNSETLPDNPYIYKIQVINQQLTIICRKGNTYEILEATLLEDKKPETKQIFEIRPDLSNVVSDISISSNGIAVIATRSGELLVMNNEKKFVDVTPEIENDIIATDLSVDLNNNIYFTEMMSGDFYRLNAASSKLDLIYNKDTVIDKKRDIKFKDLTYVYSSKDGQYFAKNKDFLNDKYAFFGEQEHFINDITENVFPNRILKFILISGVAFGLIFLIFKLIEKFQKKMTINAKIMVSFMPLYALAMLLLMSVVIKISITSYDDYLRGEQDISVHVILDEVDKLLFKKLDPIKDYLSNDYNIVDKQVRDGLSQAQNVGNRPSQYVLAYKMKDNKIYPFMGNGYFSNREEIEFRDGNLLARPVEYLEAQKDADLYYKIWGELSSRKTEKDSAMYTVEDNYGEWISVFKPIRDENNNLIGMLQGGIDKQENRNKFYVMTISLIVLLFIGVSVVIFILYFIIIKLTLKPLKEINRCVNAIGEGRWNTKLNIKSKDEFADIGKAFNIMTDRMNQYISNLVILNREYIKFIPMELCYLLGKKQITDIKLNDKNEIKINVLYVTFDKGYQETYREMAEEKYFTILNKNFDLLFNVVENNNGIIQWFDGLGMVALFNKSSEDAIKTSMQFKEVLADNPLGKYMKMLLSTGSAIIGVIGNEKRYSITVVSDEIMHMNYLSKTINKANINHFALEPIIKELGCSTKYNYRLIGQIKHILNNTPIRLYEFIDNTNQYEKNLYISTRSLFENAVETYISGNIPDARKLFANVLKINEEDKLAMYYLVLCDRTSGKDLKDWNGYM